MRKALCFITVLLLCMSLAMPAFAAEDSFVPSITYKPNPEIVSVDGEHIGVIRDEAGEIIDYVGHGCILITPVAHIWDEEIEVPVEIENLLSFLYEELNNNGMKIPYEKHEADLDAANMVIRDLFDVRWVCDEHREMIEAEGVTFEITFDLGVVADAQIFAMTYDEDAKDWNPIVSTVNNGDGTVTCTFEHLCAIEFSMPVASAPSASAEDVQSSGAMPWIIALLVASAGVVGIVVGKNKKKSAV